MLFKLNRLSTILLLGAILVVISFPEAKASDFADRMKALRQRMATEGGAETTPNNDSNVVVDENQSEVTPPTVRQPEVIPPVKKPENPTKTPPEKLPKKTVKTKKNEKKSSHRKGLLPVKAGWKVEADQVHGYRIQFPKSWQTSFMMDGPDRIKTGLSPDQNLSVRVRSFDGATGATVEMVKAAFEQRVLGGGNLLFTEKGNLCGVPSVMSVYSGQFNNIPVNMVAVVLLRGSKGYIVWTMMPANLFTARSAEADSVLATFEFTDSL